VINHSCSSRRELNQFCDKANLIEWAVARGSVGGPVVGGVVRQKGEKTYIGALASLGASIPVGSESIAMVESAVTLGSAMVVFAAVIGVVMVEFMAVLQPSLV
jgi:hypothetical protein